MVPAIPDAEDIIPWKSRFVGLDLVQRVGCAGHGRQGRCVECIQTSRDVGTVMKQSLVAGTEISDDETDVDGRGGSGGHQNTLLEQGNGTYHLRSQSQKKMNSVAPFTIRAGLCARQTPSRPHVLPPTTCWRATCFAYDDAGTRVAAFMGYDTTPAIGESTRTACKLHSKETVCGESFVMMLPTFRTECSGELYFMVHDGPVRRFFL